MNSKKILAGVLTVSIVSSLMIAYTGSSSGTPPTEREFEDRSQGLILSSDKGTAYPDSENAWRYRLHVGPEGNSGVSMQKLVIKCYTFRNEYLTEETFSSNDFKNWWGSSYIPADEERGFGAGLSSRNNIYYRDHFFVGVNDAGDEVRGAIRIYFSLHPKLSEEIPEEPPSEEEFLIADGLRASTDELIVYPNEEARWDYILELSPTGDVGVKLQEVKEIHCYISGVYVVTKLSRENLKDRYSLDTTYIAAGSILEIKEGAGGPGAWRIKFEDHVFAGINDLGEDVIATIRIHYSHQQKPEGTPEGPPPEEKTEGESLPEGVPREKEFLAQSHGLLVTSDQHTVRWDKEDGWDWTLRITPEKGLNVTLREIEIRCVAGSRVGEKVLGENSIRRIWRTCRIEDGEVREFMSGIGPNSMPPDFNDYIFTGIDDDGNEVKGTIRIYFAKSEE